MLSLQLTNTTMIPIHITELLYNFSGFIDTPPQFNRIYTKAFLVKSFKLTGMLSLT